MGYCSIHKQRLPEGCECPNCALENTHCHHSPSKSDGKCKKCGKVLFVHRKGCPMKDKKTSRCGGAGEGYQGDLELGYEYTAAPTRLDKVRQKVLARPPEGRDLVKEPQYYMVIKEKDVQAIDQSRQQGCTPHSC